MAVVARRHLSRRAEFLKKTRNNMFLVQDDWEFFFLRGGGAWVEEGGAWVFWHFEGGGMGQGGAWVPKNGMKPCMEGVTPLLSTGSLNV